MSLKWINVKTWGILKLRINFRQSKQKVLSFTPLTCERKFFILALKDSEAVFVERFSK